MGKKVVIAGMTNYFSWITLKNAPWIEVLNGFVLRAVETGLFEVNRRRAQDSVFAWSSCRRDDQRVRQLSLNHLSFAFRLLALGHGLAIISFVFEALARRCTGVF